MTVYSMLLEVDEGLNIEDTDANGDYLIGNDVVYEIAQMGGQWPSSPAPGSMMFSGRKMIQCIIDTTAADVKTLVETLIATYSLNWDILLLQSFSGTSPGVDANGDPLPPVATKLTEPNITRIFDFLPHRYAEFDEEGVPVGPPLAKDVTWVSVYQGQAAWVS